MVANRGSVIVVADPRIFTHTKGGQSSDRANGARTRNFTQQLFRPGQTDRAVAVWRQRVAFKHKWAAKKRNKRKRTQHMHKHMHACLHTYTCVYTRHNARNIHSQISLWD
ncbi:nucleolar MIF4G domain-containing protein 1 [Trichinella spiralis]|uniref:nucleolar MIF4G domain-containing protein 1 n=1 Tax=Trichinella spiralis TaxID=6334 RepID=UPI0001EFC080|nr:nucleolar MIF4G domain-containing protein 1 [Trichinella spiralis]